MNKYTFAYRDMNLTVENFYYNRTYAGILAGKPDKAFNDSILDNFYYPQEWGNIKAVYETKSVYESKDVLKPYQFSVWLSSDKGINDPFEVYDGCEVIINWFGQPFWSDSFKNIILERLKDFEWEKYAENYLF